MDVDRPRQVDQDTEPALKEATMRAKEIMTRPVCTVRPTDTVEHAAALLADNKIAAVPVLNEADEVIGMLSEADLLWRRVPADPARTSGVPPAATAKSAPRRLPR